MRWSKIFEKEQTTHVSTMRRLLAIPSDSIEPISSQIPVSS